MFPIISLLPFLPGFRRWVVKFVQNKRSNLAKDKNSKNKISTWLDFLPNDGAKSFLKEIMLKSMGRDQGQVKLLVF